MPPQKKSENQSLSKFQELRLVAWEVTRRCNLSCLHCRASAESGPYPGELSTKEGFRLLEQIRKVGQPVIIMTGGEPLLRPDVFDLARYGNSLGLRMVMAVNGTLLTIVKTQKLKEAGIQRISISMDGATAESHDYFRQVKGAYNGIIKGIEAAQAVGLEFQINTTITSRNLHELARIQEKVIELGAAAHHIFMLVPTGRGRALSDQTLSAEEYEETLTWLVKQKDEIPLSIKATCAPHFYRILRETTQKKGKELTFKTHGLDAVTRGCLGGVGFCFVSHIGQVQPCGYLEVDSGTIRKQTFSEIWESSPVFLALRDQSQYMGKCGHCEYFKVCGGCRARAFEATGNFLREEPLCTYQPRGQARGEREKGKDKQEKVIAHSRKKKNFG